MEVQILLLQLLFLSQTAIVVGRSVATSSTSVSDSHLGNRHKYDVIKTYIQTFTAYYRIMRFLLYYISCALFVAVSSTNLAASALRFLTIGGVISTLVSGSMYMSSSVISG